MPAFNRCQKRPRYRIQIHSKNFIFSTSIFIKMKEVQLKVAEAVQKDVGKGIVRIDTKIMDDIGVSPGDIVEIIDKKSTAAIATSAYPSDVGLGIIRMDGLIRANAKTGIGEMVTVRKAEFSDAKRVVIAPAQRGIRIMAGGAIFKQHLLGRPVKKGDVIMPMPPGEKREFTGTPFEEFFGGLFRLTPYSLGEIRFVVVSTNPGGIVRITNETDLEVRPEAVAVEEAERVPEVTYEDIGGLKEEVSKIREMVELPIMHPELFDRLGIEPPKGVLLHGPPGTGKTLIAKALANETDSFFISISGPEIMSKWYGESEKKLREIFDEAEKNAPSIIFIDEIDAIAPKREEVTGEVERRVVAQLLSLMDGLKARGRVVVIGATNRPDALDPALRRPGRFDREIVIGVPDRDGRKEILQIHTRGMPLAEDVDLDELADITHGFVGADLAALARESAMSALRRVLPEIDLEQKEIPKEILEKLFVTKEDFMNVLKHIEPSAMREVLVEVPKVTWDDVGGLEDVKAKLKEVVEWPLKYPESFKRIGIKPPNGVLLYGPPGCGKTLLAKAVANESEANFISVKGSDILSKWFGETERRLAEIFKKAKQVSPAIIFFDEIDAIAPMRGATVGEPRAVERIVNTILAEMDGMEEIYNLVIIGATNRPDIIDPALLRPGRFEELLLIPLPDEKARIEIFKVHTREMSLAKDVDFEELARRTQNYTGADIASICRRAGLNALREDLEAREVKMEHFEKALQETPPSVSPDIMKYYQRVHKGIEKRKDVVSPEVG
jgi:transitional endoplasmic reticulum ATPase